ncbi:hypothetical protein CAC42_3337 [Sphaceloma murrayae]|uniref:Uncharacterized protein n=1 Tax=Sphaceloma murrayae TaxID=2082308 RepID=A0A2K1R185_9PEZI|nr:hypothetical protein CAC42_3337 [Sphaceloma murrayae]
MRSFFACALVSFLSSHIFPSSAAPAVALRPKAPRQLQLSTIHTASAAVNRTDLRSEAKIQGAVIATTSDNVNQAIAIECQGCVDGADVYPVFDFGLRPDSVEGCSVTFNLNGTTAQLSRASPSSSVSILTPQAHVYLLKVELACGPYPDAQPLVVSVSIQEVDGKSPAVRPGFEAHLLDSRISRLSLLDPLTKSNTGGVQAARSGLKVENANSSSTSAPGTEKDCELHECLIQGVLSHVTSALKVGRFESFKGRVQSVMKDIKSYATCHKEKQQSVEEPLRPASSLIDTSNGPLKKLADAQSPLVVALEALASLLGLSGLLFFIRRRYCSLRRRVERLADREERMKAKEYRRAARKEAWRRRWANLKKTCTCCFGSYEYTPEDEEKCALVAEATDEGVDGEIETSLDQLDGLRYAHEIVEEMVRSRRRQANAPAPFTSSSSLIHPVDIAFHYANIHDTRSRASSLPSYNSDILPDYSSQPEVAEIERNVRIVNNFRRAASPASSDASSRRTPDSSIPDISTRPSQETLRTDPEFR